MTSRDCYRHCSFVLFVLSFFFCSDARATEFTGLGDLVGGDYASSAQGVSADGSVVVGGSISTNGTEAFRWTEAGGMVGLGDLAGGDNESGAWGVSADGSVVVGQGFSPSGGEAFRWIETSGMVGLGDLAGGNYASSAWDASADGSVVVGLGNSANGAEAFRWTEAGGMVGLGDLSGGIFSSHAVGVSENGSVVVGLGNSANGEEAFRWTETGGMVGLGDLSGGIFSSHANGVSADGNIVVGQGVSVSGYEAFRWTETGGMVGLGDLPGGIFSSHAVGVSADGSVVVGTSVSVSGYEAFRWTEAGGIQSIRELLVVDGIDMTDWQLFGTSDVSDDGTVIVGTGNSPNGVEAWVVRLGSGLLTADAVSQSVATVVPATESAHSLARESLDAHMLASRHYRGRLDAKFDLYASGFGGEWDSYTAGGTVGLTVNVTDEVRVGGGVFASRYKEDDLDYSGEYELDAVGGTMWAGYAAPDDGPQLHVVGMMAELDNEIERGYMNGSGLDSSKGDPDGNLIGIMVRAGCEVPVGEEGSTTPFASYSWTEVDIDGYAETGGGFPAQFDSRKDSAEVVKVGLEGEYTLTDTVTAWGQVAYGKRLDDDSNGISGQIVGLMAFAQPGYSLDDDWTELDLGFKWQATDNLSVMLTGGSTFGSDQNPDWRSSLGVSWSLM